MANVEWNPTVEIRYVSRPGDRDVREVSLQQRWIRQVIEYREYGGKMRHCESFEYEWRDVPTERE